MQVHGIDHIVLNTADVERSLAWYCDVLGLAAVRVDEWRAGTAPFPSARINDRCIIDLFSAPRSGDNLNHFCLVVDRADVDAVAADPRFTVVDGPGSRFGAQGDGWSVYVVDPDGNVVELRSYD
ncbi:MAG TPA: VOC family protein [Ilumatobacter sp.]|nr:VOC family protein [Ilumatobacter sp.]